ncbi:MAG: hypothetical protein AAGI25_20885 [Bacteroidota bacterium]
MNFFKTFQPCANPFDAQLTLGRMLIEEVKIPAKTRSHLAALAVAY